MRNKIGSPNMDLQRLVSEGLPYAQTCSEKQFAKTIAELNQQYHNEGKTAISDALYDSLLEYARNTWPKNPEWNSVGATPTHSKVRLPFSMSSLDKIKPDTDALQGWLQKHNHPATYIVSNKLDGVSALFINRQVSYSELYTRGDGLVGQNISHLLPYLKLDLKDGAVAVRGEIIVSKANWHKHALYNDFANPRNMVSGIVNSKTLVGASLSAARFLEFVAYELIEPAKTPQNQLVYLDYLGFQVVDYRILHELSNAQLSQQLLLNRAESPYEIDGLVVAHDAVYERTKDNSNPAHAIGNPSHIVAFKMPMNDQQTEALVTQVLWSVSKDGYLKPRVQIEPVQLCGVRIEYATGFNAKFIQDNMLGPGAIVIMERSGDVIPIIRRVVRPASMPQMPQELDLAIWTPTGVDLVLRDPQGDAEVQKKRITAFFKMMKIEGLSEGNVQRLYETGFRTIVAILRMTERDFLLVDGFKDKMAEKLYRGIQEGLRKASLVDWMVASGVFGRGFGSRKMQSVVDALTVREMTLEDLVSVSSTNVNPWSQWLRENVEGMGLETAREFVVGVPRFLEFQRECNINAPVKTPTTNSGKQIVLTKVRKTKEIADWAEKAGVQIADQVTKKTDLVIYSGDDSNNLRKARALGIPCIEVGETKVSPKTPSFQFSALISELEKWLTNQTCKDC